MFCLLVMLVELSVIAKWLARKTPLRKPNRGEGIVFRNPRPKSVHDFLGLLYCFIVLWCICVVSCSYVVYYPTVMARYSLLLKVPLNPKQANKKLKSFVWSLAADGATWRTRLKMSPYSVNNNSWVAAIKTYFSSKFKGLKVVLEFE